MWAESSDIHIITYKKFCSKLKSVIFLDWPILCVELWTSKKTAKRDVVTIHLLFVDTSWLFLYFFIYTWALNTINDLNRPRTFFFHWCYCWCCVQCSVFSKVRATIRWCTHTEPNAILRLVYLWCVDGTLRNVQKYRKKSAHVHGNTKRAKMPRVFEHNVFCLILSFLIPYRIVNIPAIEITITTMPIICATSARHSVLLFFLSSPLCFLRLQFLLLFSVRCWLSNALLSFSISFISSISISFHFVLRSCAGCSVNPLSFDGSFHFIHRKWVRKGNEEDMSAVYDNDEWFFSHMLTCKCITLQRIGHIQWKWSKNIMFPLEIVITFDPSKFTNVSLQIWWFDEVFKFRYVARIIHANMMYVAKASPRQSVQWIPFGFGDCSTFSRTHRIEGDFSCGSTKNAIELALNASK